jgi:protein CpxP
MESRGNPFTHASARLFFAAALAALLALAPGVVAAAADKASHEDRAELRIKDMRVKLMITQAQEEQWAKVALVMRDNAKTMDSLTQARAEHAKDMTAVDDMKSYGEIVDAHADGIKKLTPVFAELYAGMSDPQKKVADTLFRHGDRKHGGHQRSQKKSQGN